LYKNNNFDFNLTIQNIKLNAQRYLDLQWTELVVTQFIKLLTEDSLSAQHGNLNNISHQIFNFCDLSIISKRDIKLLFYKLRQEDCYSDDKYFEMAMNLELNTEKKRNDFISIYRYSDNISKKVIKLKEKMDENLFDKNEEKVDNEVNNIDIDIDNDIIDLMASDNNIDDMNNIELNISQLHDIIEVNNDLTIESSPILDQSTKNSKFQKKPTPFPMKKTVNDNNFSNTDNRNDFLKTTSFIGNEVEEEL
jgi:hypothetical protein